MIDLDKDFRNGADFTSAQAQSTALPWPDTGEAMGASVIDWDQVML